MDHSNYDLSFFQLPTSWMAPFCLVRQWMRLYEFTEGQRLLWLCSPILEWQSLWHPSHMDDEGSCIEDALFLFFCLLVVSASALFSSRVANPSHTACRQAPRSAATSSHKSWSMAVSP